MAYREKAELLDYIRYVVRDQFAIMDYQKRGLNIKGERPCVELPFTEYDRGWYNCIKYMMYLLKMITKEELNNESFKLD